MINVLIVDDNKDFDIQLHNYIKSNSNKINIIGITTNGKEALDFLLTNNIDIILLDLEMPKLNGLEFINELQKSNLLYIPKIIIMSSHIRLINKIHTINISIENTFLKPFDMSELIKFIVDTNKDINDDLIYLKINNLLSHFEFNTNNIGYTFFMDSIFLSIKNPTLLNQLNGLLYPEVSKMNNNINIKKIKWNIEKSIRSMIKYTSKNKICEFFSYTNAPSPKTFISKMVKLLKETKYY